MQLQRGRVHMNAEGEEPHVGDGIQLAASMGPRSFERGGPCGTFGQAALRTRKGYLLPMGPIHHAEGAAF